MRKLSFAAVVVLALSGAGFVTPAPAAPGLPMGVTASDTLTPVRYRGGQRRYARNARKKAQAYRMNSYKKARAHRINSYKKRRAYQAAGRRKYYRSRRFY